MKKMTPERAIRKYCLRCSCGDKNEVELCNIISCPLYDYRLGESKTTEEHVDETTVGDLLDVKGSKVVLETTEQQETTVSESVVKKEEVVEEAKNPEKKERKPRKKKETKVETESKQEETKVETESKQEETKVETESKQEETKVETTDDLNLIDLDDLFD